jgi:osmotically-inducible protein OsmY
MADRNFDSRNDRRPRWNNAPGEQGRESGYQQEQYDSGNAWDDVNASQMGESSNYDPDYAQGARSRRYGAAERSQGGSTGQWSDRGNSPRQARQDYSRTPADFDAAGYRNQGRNYGSFTADDFGGRDFSNPAGNRQGAGGGYGAAPSNAYGQGGYGNDRGFFERAGDEVASWFGDEDAARRREQDHTGRGPGNYTRSDERILEDACDRITDDWRVDGTHVQVTVAKGEVTLDGTVSTREQKRRAEDCVDHISGVKHVQNNLRIDPSSGVARDENLDDKPAPFI